MSPRSARILTQTRNIVLLSIGACIILLPYVVMLSTSLKSQAQIYAASFELIPDKLHWMENYGRALSQVPLLRFMLNGLVVCVGILLLQIATAVPCAYALAKLNFKGRETLFALVLAGLLIPHQVTAIPLYVAIASSNMLDTYGALIAPFVTSVFAIFLFRQFFRSFPDDIINAARLDGMSEFEIVWRIVTPSAWPAIAAFSVFSAVAHWNDLYWPLIVISDAKLAPPPLGMMFFADAETGSNYGALTAAATILTAPLVIAFLVARRRFIDGITMTGVK